MPAHKRLHSQSFKLLVQHHSKRTDSVRPLQSSVNFQMSLLYKRATALERRQLVPSRPSKAAVGLRRGARVVRRFKNTDEERLRELAQLPEQPITMKYPPPTDLANIIPNPGARPLLCMCCSCPS